MTKHGLARHNGRQHPLYGTWTNMMSRCYNRKVKSFRDYGARGITVCERWHDPQTFIGDIEREIGPSTPGMTLDRIDNDGAYKPGNVQWATRLEQNRKRRSSRAGRSTHPLYQIWWNITHRYPGEVCEPWHDFAIFTKDVERLLGQRPDRRFFGRIDDSCPYEPGNVAWLTGTQQIQRAQAARWAR